MDSSRLRKSFKPRLSHWRRNGGTSSFPRRFGRAPGNGEFNNQRTSQSDRQRNRQDTSFKRDKFSGIRSNRIIGDVNLDCRNEQLSTSDLRGSLTTDVTRCCDNKNPELTLGRNASDYEEWNCHSSSDGFEHLEQKSANSYSVVSRNRPHASGDARLLLQRNHRSRSGLRERSNLDSEVGTCSVASRQDQGGKSPVIRCRSDSSGRSSRKLDPGDMRHFLSRNVRKEMVSRGKQRFHHVDWSVKSRPSFRGESPVDDHSVVDKRKFDRKSYHINPSVTYTNRFSVHGPEIQLRTQDTERTPSQNRSTRGTVYDHQENGRVENWRRSDPVSGRYNKSNSQRHSRDREYAAGKCDRNDRQRQNGNRVSSSKCALESIVGESLALIRHDTELDSLAENRSYVADSEARACGRRSYNRSRSRSNERNATSTARNYSTGMHQKTTSSVGGRLSGDDAKRHRSSSRNRDRYPLSHVDTLNALKSDRSRESVTSTHPLEMTENRHSRARDNSYLEVTGTTHKSPSREQRSSGKLINERTECQPQPDSNGSRSPTCRDRRRSSTPDEMKVTSYLSDIASSTQPPDSTSVHVLHLPTNFEHRHSLPTVPAPGTSHSDVTVDAPWSYPQQSSATYQSMVEPVHCGPYPAPQVPVQLGGMLQRGWSQQPIAATVPLPAPPSDPRRAAASLSTSANNLITSRCDMPLDVTFRVPTAPLSAPPIVLSHTVDGGSYPYVTGDVYGDSPLLDEPSHLSPVAVCEATSASVAASSLCSSFHIDSNEYSDMVQSLDSDKLKQMLEAVTMVKTTLEKTVMIGEDSECDDATKQKKTAHVDVVADEVKAALKPFFLRNEIDKEEYKDIMRRAVPKIAASKHIGIDRKRIRCFISDYVSKVKAAQRRAVAAKLHLLQQQEQRSPDVV